MLTPDSTGMGGGGYFRKYVIIFKMYFSGSTCKIYIFTYYTFVLGHFVCPPDSYNCHESSICIKPDQICDGYKHCPDADDEHFCGMV